MDDNTEIDELLMLLGMTLFFSCVEHQANLVGELCNSTKKLIKYFVM